jgi:hypothetical protein
MPPKSNKTLRNHWIAGGIASSLSRFIPLPLVDGFIDERAKRYSLDRTLDHHGRKFKASDVDELYKDSTTVPGWVASKFKQLALYPVRKVTKIVTASTGVPKDFARTYLLARAVDVCLKNDLLKNSSTSAARAKEAKSIRAAFDTAFEELDDMLFATTTKIIRREFSEMGPEVSAALAKIIGKTVKAKESTASARSKGNNPKRTSSNPEKDAAFSDLITQFDELFGEEMAKRDLAGA